MPLSFNRHVGPWLIIGVLFALLVALLYGTYLGWTAHSGDVDVPPWALGMLAAGAILGLVVGCGLMALLFYSSRKGYDDEAATPPEPKQEGKP